MPRRSSASGAGGLRAATARGGVVNAAFLSGAEALVLVQGLLATALLGPDAIGLYGIVTTTAMTIVALRRVGIDEAFVQEQATDEEAEFQRAFTVELALAVAATLLIAACAPLLAALYDDDTLLPLTLAVAYLPLAFALQAPQWIFFRRMDYLRLRMLQAIVPLGTVAVTVPLLLAGVGVWALVIGPACGNALAVLAALRASPYRLRLRPDSRRRAALPALLVADLRHRGRSAGGRAGPDRGVRPRRGPGRRGLDHAGGDAHALRRPRGPDPRHDRLSGDRARPRPARGARGDVRQVEPARAHVGVPVRRRARAVRRRPRELRARRRVGEAPSC